MSALRCDSRHGPTDSLGRSNLIKRGPKRRPGRYIGAYKQCTEYGWRGKWYASIVVDGGRRYLGVFDSAKEAALAYDKAAKREHGARATLNFPVKKRRSYIRDLS